MTRRKKKAGEQAKDKEVNFGLATTPENLNCFERGQYYKELFKTEYIEIAEQLSGAGFTEKDLAYSFNVPPAAIESWKRLNSTFKEACVNGRQRIKKRLVAKSFLSAIGYDYKTSKIRTIRDADGNVLKEETTEFKNHQPANHNLLMFILCNIDRQLGDGEWMSKHKLEVENTKNVNIQIDGTLATEQIAKLAGRLLGEPERKYVESTVVGNERD